jgi:hypothetical protein
MPQSRDRGFQEMTQWWHELDKRMLRKTAAQERRTEQLAASSHS